MPFEIAFSAFGPPDVLVWSADGDNADPLPSQIVIRVIAAGINGIDAQMRSGEMTGTQLVPLPSVPGREAAGIVVAVGSGVTAVAIGDSVVGFTDSGAYAEFAVMTHFVPKPARMPWEVAAAIPVAGEMAVRLLSALRLARGERLVVAGGAGRVGALVTQLAVAQGVRVVATVRAEDEPYVRSVGATPVRYGRGFADRVYLVSPSGMDGAVDTAGSEVLPDLITMTGGAHRVVSCAGATADRFGVSVPEPLTDWHRKDAPPGGRPGGRWCRASAHRAYLPDGARSARPSRPRSWRCTRKAGAAQWPLTRGGWLYFPLVQISYYEAPREG